MDYIPFIKRIKSSEKLIIIIVKSSYDNIGDIMQNNNDNNNIRKTIPEPLLFIHSVSTPILSNGSQRYYDSRNPETSKKDRSNGYVFHQNKNVDKIDFFNQENRRTDELLRKKLENLVQMYTMNHPIPTLIETINNVSFEGIPYKIEDDVLFLRQNETHLEIPLGDIKDAIILKI